jgi:hypothetical protein
MFNAADYAGMVSPTGVLLLALKASASVRLADGAGRSAFLH